jgi:hypothetical protein
MKNNRPYISQNKASKLIGRVRLTRYMKEGIIEFKREENNKLPRVWCKTADVKRVYELKHIKQ